MATTEAPPRAHDRHFRKRPFSAWMKRLANFKTSSAESSSNTQSPAKRNAAQATSKSKKTVSEKEVTNNPYPASAAINREDSESRNGHLSFRTPPSVQSPSMSSVGPSGQSTLSSVDGVNAPAQSNRSTAPTIATNPDTTHSDAANSSKADSTAAATNITIGGAMSSHEGGGSTFSSPAHSEQSLTTTLTTIQSTAPSNLMAGTTNSQGAPLAPTQSNHSSQAHNSQPSHFTHQFSSSPPPSALPTHLVPQSGNGNPTTYSTATANNLLTDNASILTLASSSKRRRRHSLDTDASVRALAPSSLWGGSRESLPLSVLSANAVDPNVAPAATLGGLHQNRPPAGGMASGERASVYSASGIGPALSSERNSYYAGRQNFATDGGSVKSGLLGHGRNDSITGSIGGASSPLASPREVSSSGQAVGRISRRNSGWGEVSGDADDAGDREKGSLKDVENEKERGA
ncbi:MAG: hypothetical protein M1837_000875 [Sclerophora amabilis]|nr:MAG: hypothetical protein M1837_000875 [Sclerophora amabilis]